MEAKKILCVCLVLCFGCSTKTFKNEAELLNYIKDTDNGYTQHKSINGVEYTLTYRPTDALVLQELGDHINGERIEQLRNKYKKYMYFNLSMSENNQELLSAAPKNRNEFGAMVNQLVFGMKDKVHVYTKHKDTLEMADYVYPRMYGFSKSTTMLFVYPREAEALKEDYLNFTVEDLGLDTGDVKFKIPTDKLINEPTITFKD